jgi:CRP/FNR family transcriptional regulator, cyclic AMP receptor protein
MSSRDGVENLYLFRGAEPADLDAVAAIAEAKAYGAGEYIFDVGQPADAMFSIALGMVEIRGKGKDVAVVTLGSGQTLGDPAFFVREPRPGSAYTREPTHVLRFPFAALDRLLGERPGLALVFYRNAAAHFAHHLQQLAGERERPYF